MRRTSLRRLLGVLLVAGFAVPRAAPAQFKIIEHAVETRADSATLPTGPGSALLVTPCAGCPLLRLPATAGSQYFIGREPVTLEAFRKQLASRPTAMLTVFYRRESRELTRAVVTP